MGEGSYCQLGEGHPLVWHRCWGRGHLGKWSKLSQTLWPVLIMRAIEPRIQEINF